MVTVGDLTTKVGNQDYLTWQTLQEDGVTAIDLSAATGVTLSLKNLADDAVTEFKTTDVPQQLFITDVSNGKIQLRPAASDFSAKAVYSLEIIVVDSIGNHNIPNDKYYTFKVI
jgi:hypothetical protein